MWDAGWFDITNKIQSFDIFKDSEIDGISYKTDSDGNPNVFKLKRNDDGLWLNDNWAKPTNQWNLDNRFVFRIRKYILFRT